MVFPLNPASNTPHPRTYTPRIHRVLSPESQRVALSHFAANYRPADLQAAARRPTTLKRRCSSLPESTDRQPNTPHPRTDQLDELVCRPQFPVQLLADCQLIGLTQSAREWPKRTLRRATERPQLATKRCDGRLEA